MKLYSTALLLPLLFAEVGIIMADDLAPKPDGTPYAASEVWAAVEFVVPVIEICGRRSSAECLATQVAALPPACPPASACPHVYVLLSPCCLRAPVPMFTCSRQSYDCATASSRKAGRCLDVGRGGAREAACETRCQTCRPGPAHDLSTPQWRVRCLRLHLRVPRCLIDFDAVTPGYASLPWARAPYYIHIKCLIMI
jgi:hypothetical protein